MDANYPNNLISYEKPDENCDLILLRGCGQTTEWKFPANRTSCPVTGCLQKFRDRLAAIEHFQKSHARKSIFCYACNAPMVVYNDTDFENHYRRIHPDIGIPIQFNQKIKEEPSTENVEQKCDVDKENARNENENDLITLYGCGQITCWRFPEDMTFCPVSSCNETFEIRSVAIKHYKDCHAHHSILCSICDKVITTYSYEGYMEHFCNFHPLESASVNFDTFNCNSEAVQIKENAPEIEKDNGSDEQMKQLQQTDDDLIRLGGCNQIIQWQFPPNIKMSPHEETPLDFGQNNTPASMEEKEKERIYLDDDGVDDLIALEGCGITTKWMFPESSTICPVRLCKYQGSSRSDAIIHYKRHHAKNAILCSLCNKPISVQNNEFHFVRHYRACHPSRKIPFKFDTKGMIQNNQKLSDKENDLIILRGCGQITEWRFPPNLTDCPINSCQKTFDSRLNAIKHYKLEHADHTILCSPCKKPVKSCYPKIFVAHYKKMHPHNEIPFDFGNMSFPTEKTKPFPKTTHEDDLIELSGCGVKTKWKFPVDSMTCPVKRCEKTFATRSLAIDHYKRKHAQNAIYCSKPIATNGLSISVFKTHYKQMHRYQKIPFILDCKKHFTEEISSKNQLSQLKSCNDESSEDSEDDLITLSGGGMVSIWRFPKKMKQCPVESCGLKFGVRSDVIVHYKKRHAMNHFYCSTCDKTISTNQHQNLKEHCIRSHLNSDRKETIRICTEDTKEDDLMAENACDSEPNEANDDDDDDLIRLEACGKRTIWRFPANTRICPFFRCHKRFKNRSAAIAHYKRRHSKNSIYCPICKKPIRTYKPSNFISHCRRVHLRAEIPYTFGTQRGQCKASVAQNKSPTKNNIESKTSKAADHRSNDLITLTGWGRRSKWQFPLNEINCPVVQCKEVFNNRSDAIEHYKEKHSMHAVLCNICKKPIIATCRSNYKSHFLKVHPNEPIPIENSNLANKTVCKKCGKSVITHNLPRHIIEVHSSKRVCCPLMDCKFTTKRIGKVRSHWAKFHGSIKFPEFRYKSEISFETNGTSDDDSDYEEISKPSTSKRSRDSLPQRSVKKHKRRSVSNFQDDSNDSLLQESDAIAANETSSQNESSEPLAEVKARLVSGRRRCSSSSRDSSDKESNQSAVKQVKPMKMCSDHHLPDVKSSTEDITLSVFRSMKMLECSVVLQRSDSIEMLQLNASQEAESQQEWNQIKTKIDVNSKSIQ